MPTWMIVMGLQVIFFIFSGACVILWMRGKPDIYDDKLFESTRRFLAERRAKQAEAGSQPMSEEKSK